MKDLYEIQSVQLSTLLRDYFIVCKNNVQRDFVWKKETCEKLFNDILDEKDMYYGLNSMGFSRVNDYDKILECYDGQQRLTTFTLMILSFYFMIEENVDDDNKKKIIILRNLKNHMLKYDNSDYVQKLVFSPNDGNKENIKLFNEILNFESFSDYKKHTENRKENKYCKIIEHFMTMICDIYYNQTNDPERHLDKIYNRIPSKTEKNVEITRDDKFFTIVNHTINKPIIIKYMGSDTEKYKQFINQRKGEKLLPNQYFETKLNEIKNLTTNHLIVHKMGEFLDIFNEIKYVDDDNGDYKSNDKLIKYILSYVDGKSRNITDNLIDVVFEKYNEFKNVEDINVAISISKIYIDILRIKNDKHTEFLDESNDCYLNIINQIKTLYDVLNIRDQLTEVIIQLFMLFNTNYCLISEYLDLLIKFSFLEYKVFNSKDVDLRDLVPELISVLKSMVENPDIEKVKNILKREIKFNSERFNTTYHDQFEKLKDLKYFNEKSFTKKIIKHILIEFFKSKEDDEMEELNFESLTIEHIIPVKWYKNYSYLLDENNKEDDIELAVNSIGNFGLLTLNANRKLSNRSIDQKTKMYGKSKSNENQRIFNILNGTEKVDIEFILNRHSEIIDFICKHYEII